MILWYELHGMCQNSMHLISELAVIIFLLKCLEITLDVICHLQLDGLQGEADRLSEEKPEEAEAIHQKISQITELWQELKTMVISFTHFVCQFKWVVSDSCKMATNNSQEIVLFIIFLPSL